MERDRHGIADYSGFPAARRGWRDDVDNTGAFVINPDARAGVKGSKLPDFPVHREFWSDLLRRITRRTRGAADSEDLLQAAFVRLEQYRRDHQVQNPAAFLVRTAVNIWVDNHRHDKHARNYVAELGRNGQICAPLQDEVIAVRERLYRAKEGIDRLSPRTREVFLMHRLDELKYHEIAKKLGISQSAVEKHIAKASLFLTDWIEGW